jgi:hypothetical protein
MANHGRMSIAALHRETGLDRTTIAERLEKAGLEFETSKNNAKLYDTEKALEILGAVETGAEGSKLRKLKADAEKQEIIVRKLRGELVSVPEMRQAAGELVKVLYQRIVRVEPGIIAAKCVGKGAIEIESIMHDAMALVFSELRSMPEQFLGVGSEDDECRQLDSMP